MTVYAPLLGNLWRTLESYGVDPRHAIDRSLFRPGRDDSISNRISFKDYDDVVMRSIEMAGDPAIGIRSARFIHPSHLGALGYAWMASSSLRMALQCLDRFSAMFNEHARIEVHERKAGVRIQYRMLQKASHPDILGEAHLANLLALCRLNAGPNLFPTAVKLTRPRPGDCTPWFEWFGEVVVFGQSENSMDLGASDVDAELTSSNQELVRMHEDIIRRHLDKLDRKSTLNRVRLNIIEQLPSGRVTGDEMARALNVSRRTLRRKLSEEGESFRSVLMKTRKDLADHYIRNNSYNLTEIAFLLGYRDTSAFSRAFRQWFGISPSQAREKSRRR